MRFNEKREVTNLRGSREEKFEKIHREVGAAIVICDLN
jgi:hypothetical protein